MVPSFETSTRAIPRCAANAMPATATRPPDTRAADPGALLGPVLTFARIASTLTLGVAAGLLAPLALAPVAAPALRSFAPDARLPLVTAARATATFPRLRVAASHAIGLSRRLLPYLLAGLVVASAFEALAPEGALAQLVPHSALQVLVAATIGLPLYLCEGEEVPLALAIVAAGGSPGAALAFMIAGAAYCSTGSSRCSGDAHAVAWCPRRRRAALPGRRARSPHLACGDALDTTPVIRVAGQGRPVRGRSPCPAARG